MEHQQLKSTLDINFDIFKDSELISPGRGSLLFMIYRKGKKLSERSNPYTADELKKEFGEGTYKIIAYRSSFEGRSSGYIAARTIKV